MYLTDNIFIIWNRNIIKDINGLSNYHLNFSIVLDQLL